MAKKSNGIGWIANLPENGMFRHVAKEAEMLAEISNLEKALAARRRDLRVFRSATRRAVAVDWSADEIAEAKRRT